MKLKSTFVYLFCFFAITVIASSKEVTNLIFNPLSANIYEARIGSVFTNSEKKLRLDIGGNYDFWQKQLNEKIRIGTGVEFYTYTRLRSEGRLKFPVETTDFYFGLNLSAIKEFQKFDLESRLRLGHISTHLSDGFSKNSTFYQAPFVYSKEFFDLTVAIRKGSFRPYIGAIINFSKQPKNLNLFVPQIGIEFDKKIYRNIHFLAALDHKLNGYDNKYLGMNTVTSGLEFRTAQNRGILLKVEYYAGQDYYGQFFKERLEYFGVGFEFKYH
jgi:hypothetical protein